MSDSPQIKVAMEEQVPLQIVAESGEAQNNDTRHQVIRMPSCFPASCCEDKHHRKLAICSIICGCSCIGIKALINSVKAKTTRDKTLAERYSQQAKKFGIISIVVWISILVSAPLLLMLISYLLTFKD
ncbi:transmembrane protein 265-like [Scomber japonicus]|uniref:transmembrane protein 265-like n=1 Tax=Scomber japonicus TaxID=13676 RepID=UPI002304EA53|nr:transmembrane protein 265-like [Scomber japonicus]